jgi:hypothetical protein
MAGKTQEALLEQFRSIAAGSPANSSGLLQTSNNNTAGITGSDTSIPVVGNPPPPSASSGTSSSSGSSALSLASEVFGSGLGVIPLVTGLLGLFEGGSSGPPPLTKYVMPQKLDFTGADTSSGIAETSYDQFGTPRVVGAPSSRATSGGGSAGAASAPISISVQAMDAQSVMDRSNDIAQAVRQAMLTSSSINDVINEL